MRSKKKAAKVLDDSGAPDWVAEKGKRSSVRKQSFFYFYFPYLMILFFVVGTESLFITVLN